MDDGIASHLAAACSRSALHSEAFVQLRELFPDCQLLRLSFGLQNKVMLSITVQLAQEGRTHASYVPIHPTAAAAAVLQNNPVVVVRQDKRSPLWDQEDLYQREGCAALSVVSMPFYWPPRAGAQWEGAPLPVPQNPAFHPTFGALTAAGQAALTQDSMHLLLDLAARTGRHVGPHISMLLSSLEAAGLLPSEADAQEELGMGEEDAGSEGEEGIEDLFGFEDAQHLAADTEAADLLPALGPPPPPANPGIPCCPQQRAEPADWMVEEAAAARAAAAARLAAAGEGGDEAGAEAGAEDAPEDEAEGGAEASSPSSPVAAAAASSTAAPPAPALPHSRPAPASGSGPGAGAASALATMEPRPGRPQSADGRQPGPPGRPSPPPQLSAAPTPAGPRSVAAGRQPAGGQGGGVASSGGIASSGGATPAAAPALGGAPPAAAPTPASSRSSGAAVRGLSPAAALGSRRRRERGSNGGGGFSVPIGSAASMSSLLPWQNLTFQPEGLERAFIAHYSRRQERRDLAMLAALVLGLLAAAAARLQAAWPAGVAAMLLFSPYFFDAQLYQSQREKLVAGAQLLLSVFLASLAPPAPPLGAAACAAAAACDLPGSGRGSMAGFGICWFVLHHCGLLHVLAAPLLLRLPMNRALPVQGASLAMALYRLPGVYAGMLGRLDTVHVLLLGLLLAAGALAALAACQTLERRQREVWLARRVRRGAGMSAAAVALMSPR